MSNTDVQIIVLANINLAFSHLEAFVTLKIIRILNFWMSSWSGKVQNEIFSVHCGRLGQAIFCEILNCVTPTVSDKLNFPLQSTSKVQGWKNLFIPRFSAYWVPHQRWCSALWARPTAQPSPEPVLQPCRWCDQNWSWSPSFPLSWPVSLPSTVLSLQFSLPVNSNLLLSTLYTST